PVPMNRAGPLYLEAVMPAAAAPGPATLIVQPPQGPSLSQTVSVRVTSPGLFPESVGAPRGFAWDRAGHYFALGNCIAATRCFVALAPFSWAAGGLVFVLYATALRAGGSSIKVRIGTYTLESAARPHADIAGVDELRFHLPQDFPLRLYQTILAETPDG